MNRRSVLIACSNAIEGLIGRKLTSVTMAQLTQGPTELDLIRSGLDDVTRRLLSHQPALTQRRTNPRFAHMAAMIIALE